MNELHSTRPLIQSSRRLSQSLLWDILGDYYRKQGLDAWKDSTIPYHITSNPGIAHAYARVVFGYLQDLNAADRATAQAGAQPLPIVELGAGSGAFAFHFLRQFEQIRSQSPLPDVPFLYVMTDFVPATVDGWQRHPQLAPFVEAGLLDFACFNPLKDTELTLRETGRLLSPQQPSSLVAIANYLFDSLPQDLFGVEDGKLFEIGVSIFAPPPQETAADGRPSLKELEFEYVYAPTAAPYYDDAGFERVLRSYCTLHGEVIRFPLGALTCCRSLRAIAGDDLLLLTADRGFVHREDLASEQVDALFNIHDDTFSMPVNFHAVGEYLSDNGGAVLLPARGHRSLCVTAFVTRPKLERQATHAAFHEYIARLGPDDLSTLTYLLSAEQTLPVNAIVALLRLTRHDPMVFKRCLPALRTQVEKIGDADTEVLVEEIALLWANYYEQGDRYNLPFEIAVLMERLQRPAQAIAYYQHARQFYGDDPETLFNLAACHHKLGAERKALSLIAEAAQLEIAGPPLVQRHYRRRLEALRSAVEASVGER